MPKTITLGDAAAEGIVREGHYLVITTPKDVCTTAIKDNTGYREDQHFKIKAGSQKLWRLESGLKLWGSPTQKRLALVGCKGMMYGPDIMKKLVEELYALPGFFEEVRASSLPKVDYVLPEEVKAIELQVGIRHKHSDDQGLSYWLASRSSEVNGEYASSHIFYVYNGNIYRGWLFDSNNYTNELAYSVRPEATPSANIILDVEGCDGTNNNPWRCLGK